MDLIVNEGTKALYAVSVAILTAWLTVSFAMRRFKSEQWWSRKADSYAAVFAAAHSMKLFLNASLENQIGNVAQAQDRLSSLAVQWQRGEDHLAKAVDMGLFLFSNATVAELEALQQDLSKLSIHDMSWENILPRIDRIDQFLVSLRQLARHDLGVSGRLLGVRGAA